MRQPGNYPSENYPSGNYPSGPYHLEEELQESSKESSLESIKLEPRKGYTISVDSRIPRDVALQGLQRNPEWVMTNMAKFALKENNIIAVIDAYGQPFWLLDMRNDRQFADANIPYILVEANSPRDAHNNNPYAYYKGIRPGETVPFGRSHDYGGRFIYSNYVSRNHFDIKCGKDGKITISDLGSLNGTSIMASFESLSSDEGKPPEEIKESFDSDREVNIDGRKIQLAEMAKDRSCPHLIVFVESDQDNKEAKGFKPRLFYKSNSSMMWRYTPYVTPEGHIFKSDCGEDAVNAPFELQQILNDIDQNQPEKEFCTLREMSEKANDPDISLDNYGTISGIISKRLVDGRPSLTPECQFNGYDMGSRRYEIADPQECVVPNEKMPNFNQIVRSWDTTNDLYGDTKARCFRSNDGTLEYLFFQNHEGRAWVGAVECVDSKISKLGVKKEYINPGCLTTPLYEYHVPRGAFQDVRKGGGYWGNPNDRKGYYVGMDEYLNRIPMIQEFHRYYG